MEASASEALVQAFDFAPLMDAVYERGSCARQLHACVCALCIISG